VCMYSTPPSHNPWYFLRSWLWSLSHCKFAGL